MVGSNIGQLLALSTAICWAISATYYEASGKKIGSLFVNYITLIMGFAFISIFTYFTRGMIFPIDATSKTWLFLSMSGFIGFFIGDFFLFRAYVEIGSRIAMLIMASSPPITALLEFLIFGEKLTKIGILGMIVTILGISIVILSRNPEEKKIELTHSIKGITYALLGSVGQAIGLIFSKIGMGNYNPFAATQIRIIAGILSFTVLLLFLNKWDDLKIAIKDKKTMGKIAIGSIFGPFLGVSLALSSLKYTTAGISATITSIVPVIIIPFSIIVFKEKVTFKEVLGSITTVVGVGMLFLF